MKTRALFTLNALVLFLLLLSQGASAQEQDAPKLEVGVQYSSLSINLPGFFSGGTDRRAFGWIEEGPAPLSARVRSTNREIGELDVRRPCARRTRGNLPKVGQRAGGQRPVHAAASPTHFTSHRTRSA